MIVKSDGEPTYFAGDARTTSTSASAGFDRCIILLGADHHGYVGRMMALCACVRRRARASTSRSSSARWSTCSATAGRADGQARRQHHHAGRPGRGGRRRRRPLRAGAQLGRLADRHRPRPLDQAHQRQPGLLRAVRPRAVASAAQRRRARPTASGSRPASTRRCSPTRRRATAARRARRVPARGRAAAELREPHRVARYLEELAGTYHRFYDAAGCCPRATRTRYRPAPGPALARRGHAAGPAPTGWACSGSPPPSACRRCHAHP